MAGLLDNDKAGGEPGKEPEANTRDYQKLEQYVRNLFKEMETERRFIEPMWREISDYLLPSFSGWDYEIDQDITAGQLMFNGSPIAAHNRLADGIFGWLVAPTIPWLTFEPEKKEDKDDKAFMKYMRQLQMHMYEVFNRSNFYDAISEDIHTCSGIGTSVITVDNAEELGLPIYTPLHPREVYISENRYRRVDILARKYQLTNRQVVEEFASAYDEKELKMMMQEPEKKLMILQVVYPNNEYIDDGSLKLGGNKKYRSVHIVYQGQSPNSRRKHSILKVSGMDYRKFEVWRFKHVSGQVYGSCPAMDAIYDIKMCHLQSKTMADVSQLAARPPTQTDEMMKGKVRIAPNGVTYGPYPVTPIFPGGVQYPYGIDAMKATEERLKEHFKTEFFMSINQLQQGSRDRTATEIMEIKAEAAAVMGSVVGRIQSERLEPLVYLTMLIEKEAGRLPEAPAELDPSKRFAVRFIGPLAQSQMKYLRVNGIQQGLGSLMQLAQAAPEVMANADMNWAARELMVANGYPDEGLRSKEEVQQIQQAQAQQQQAMMQAQMENERMKAMGQAGAAPEEGSVVKKLMEG